MRGVLGKLKREQAGLILLRAEGFGYTEIGAVLNLKTTSVGKLLARAEEAFRKEYIHRYGKPGSLALGSKAGSNSWQRLRIGNWTCAEHWRDMRRAPRRPKGSAPGGGGCF